METEANPPPGLTGTTFSPRVTGTGNGWVGGFAKLCHPPRLFPLPRFIHSCHWHSRDVRRWIQNQWAADLEWSCASSHKGGSKQPFHWVLRQWGRHREVCNLRRHSVTPRLFPDHILQCCNRQLCQRSNSRSADIYTSWLSRTGRHIKNATYSYLFFYVSLRRSTMWCILLRYWFYWNLVLWWSHLAHTSTRGLYIYGGLNPISHLSTDWDTHFVSTAKSIAVHKGERAAKWSN